ncbi:unnamed protein product [Oppiella nova]|uniref:Uncharacterized protein n=1 Tax=Oppiella nova TaxID=334625 RepID=A0A7R9QW25_9ACAR|nr:unnamed protein product [Oppiella nova]CAG2177699.1 unnamed protein product [Oppiella nova]
MVPKNSNNEKFLKKRYKELIPRIHFALFKVSDLAMGTFSNTGYRDTLVDFPHLMPDPSILTVISSPKYYANNELFKIFNTFKLEAKELL